MHAQAQRQGWQEDAAVRAVARSHRIRSDVRMGRARPSPWREEIRRAPA
ncbi:hypothetical protein BN940_03066 [Castellaniella defragrans 65Phen]|uniref:Uncharacterized protein n=1 Tax=Castellaniella defragrans (strain DSM 12143 / CCUG 39792 / 65Phen) TaxID=1437824 RepID=W8WTS5_CASD6|nr:hypothetical protein BN940_03066 [Castellaniella defragrans 65Phen]